MIMVFFEMYSQMLKREMNLGVGFYGRIDSLILKYANKKGDLTLEPVIEDDILWVFDSYIFRDEDNNLKICYTSPLFICLKEKEIILETTICWMEKAEIDLKKKYYFQKKNTEWIRNEDDSYGAKRIVGYI